jgi:cell division protein FtsL
MATLATILKRQIHEPQPEPERNAPAPRRVPALRPLPNEDVYFFSKRIDNSRVVRADNPQARNQCWSALGAGCAIAVMLISMLVPKLGTILLGYQIEALKIENQKLVDERANLQLVEARLTSRERLEELAASKQHQLVKPAAGQVIHLNPSADGSLAMRLGAAGR